MIEQAGNMRPQFLIAARRKSSGQADYITEGLDFITAKATLYDKVCHWISQINKTIDFSNALRY